MKKIIILLSIVVLGLALLPIIGNKFIEDTLKERIELLASHGLEIKNSSTEAGYLHTKKHYEFLLKDSQKFVDYLNQYADNQIPLYVNAMLQGVVIGTDLQFSNFPFNNALSLDIYPLALSPETTNALMQEEPELYKNFISFFEKKGILYHMNYNILQSTFDGYIKDIQEEYVLKDGSKVTLGLMGATYEGTGTLVAPSSLNSKISNMTLHVFKSTDELNFSIADFNSSSTFESQSTYSSAAQVKNFVLTIKEPAVDTVTLNASDVRISISSDTQETDARMNAKSSFANFDLSSDRLKVKAKNFNYDIALSKIDKAAFEEIRLLTAKAKNRYSDALALEMQESITKLLSKGMTLHIADISLENILFNDTQNLEGFSLASDIVLKEDANLSQNIALSPMFIAKNMNIDTMFKISKPMFNAIVASSPMVGISQSYAQEVDNMMVFHIQFDSKELKVNDKTISN